MGPRNAGIVASRILALYLAIESVSAIISFLLLARSLGGSSSFWAYVGPRLVIAWALWIMADRIGQGIATGTSDAGGASHSLVDLQTVAFIVVGIVLVVQAIPTLIQIGVSDFPPYGDFSPLRFTPYGGFGDRGGLIASEVFRLGLGIGLVFLARPLSVALHGRSKDEPPAA